MRIKSLLNRRNFLGSAGLLAGMLLNARRAFGLSAGGAPREATPDKPTGFGSTGNVYEELGVTPVINGQGTMTYLGGSLPRPEVEAAMALAAQHFVPIVDLEVAAGKRICRVSKASPGIRRYRHMRCRRRNAVRPCRNPHWQQFQIH